METFAPFFFPPSIFVKQDFWAMDFCSCPHVYHNHAHFGGAS